MSLYQDTMNKSIWMFNYRNRHNAQESQNSMPGRELGKHIPFTEKETGMVSLSYVSQGTLQVHSRDETEN